MVQNAARDGVTFEISQSLRHLLWSVTNKILGIAIFDLNGKGLGYQSAGDQNNQSYLFVVVFVRLYPLPRLSILSGMNDGQI